MFSFFHSEKTASNGMLLIATFGCLLHIAALNGWVNPNYLQGGRSTPENFIELETGSLTINVVILLVVLWRSGRLPRPMPSVAAKVLFGLLAFLFVLNTVGNLFAKTWVETLLFTPLTALSSFWSYRLSGLFQR